MKSGNLNFLEPSGPLQACNGTALPFTLLYMFWMVLPSIIRSSRLYIEQQVYVKEILLAGTRWSSISFPLAITQQYLFEIYLLLYVQS